MDGLSINEIWDTIQGTVQTVLRGSALLVVYLATLPVAHLVRQQSSYITINCLKPKLV
jgi:hypothetical protein